MNANALAEEPARSRLMEATTDVLKVIDQLQAERDQLRQRVAHLEEECKRLSHERRIFLLEWADTIATQEELDRISKEPGGRSWAEIRERLEKL